MLVTGFDRNIELSNPIYQLAINCDTGKTFIRKGKIISITTNKASINGGFDEWVETTSNFATKEEIPTLLSQLTNDSNFKTEAEIQSMINNASKLKKEVVDSLPTTGKDDVIYLVKNKSDENNVYTEYIWIDNKWEIIGDTKVNLTGYAKLIDLQEFTQQELEEAFK